jgi:hypothetical protein
MLTRSMTSAHKPTARGNALADLDDEHFEPLAAERACSVLVARWQRRRDRQVVADEERKGLGHHREIAVEPVELPAHAVKPADQRRVAARVPLWIEEAIQCRFDDGRLVGPWSLGRKFEPLRYAVGYIG